jgi:hypothetical protein
MEEDYPRTLQELERRFSTEKACREYLFDLRWPDGFRCPRCDVRKSWTLQSGRVQCADCGYQVSTTAGTVFQDTRTSLTVWFRTMWWLTSQKNGVSAVALQRVLGWGSYQTAWTCLHKLRRAMIRPGRERLAGVVEVDESYPLCANISETSSPSTITVGRGKKSHIDKHEQDKHFFRWVGSFGA